MAKYRCRNCNYLLDLRPGKRLPTKCPYCSKDGTLDPVKSAQELIDEVASIKSRDEE